MRVARLAVGLASFVAVLAVIAVAPAGADPVKCKATIAKASSQYVVARTKALVKCQSAIVAGKLPLATDCSDELKTDAAIDKAKAKMEAAIEKACGGADKECGSGGDDDPLADIGWTAATCPDIESQGCTMAITDCHAISECLECVQSEAVDRVVRLAYDELTPPSADKTLTKCQQTIGKATAAFLATKTKALAKCWDGANKGASAAPCPFPGDGKAGPAIAGAEAKMIAAICKACGGGDKGCDQAVAATVTTVPGSGGSDDLTPGVIGFPASCDQLMVPGGPSCAQPIATLADVVECLGCIAEVQVDCADRLAVPWGAGYPGQCNPGCGNSVLEPGETCDGFDAPACPGRCAPTAVPEACTCPSGTFDIDAVAGAVLDTGWTGIAHRQGALVGHLFTADTYGCTSGGPDKLCSFVARYDSPFFGAPLPLSSGGIPTCILNEVVGRTSGTLDLATGDLVYDYTLRSRVHSSPDVAVPCPRCDGDATPDDDVKDGTCSTGPNAGGACDADGVSALFGATSFDCLPDPGLGIGILGIAFDDATTGTKVRTTSPASPNCVDLPAAKCLCSTCNNLNQEACASNADCPPSGGNPGICGGRRCVQGSNVGNPCTTGSHCPGGLCGIPGEPSRPNACIDDTQTPEDGTICLETGGGEAFCPDKPFTSNCAPPEQFRGCSSDTQVTDCPLTGTCLSDIRRCFPAVVTRTGTPGLTNGAYAADFCIGPTTSGSVNQVAGLPGLGTIVLPYTLAIDVP